jgi:hypothetical protein
MLLITLEGRDRPVTTRLRTSEEPHLAHWLGYSAFAGWVAGPLLGAAYWLGRGGGASGALTLGPGSDRLPLAGFTLVWAVFIAMTRSALAVGWGRAAGWATTVLLAGSVGWLFAQFLHPPTGGSINTLVLAWTALTVPYPAVAACSFRRAVRPAEPADLDPLHRAAHWLTRHRPHAVAVGCVAALGLGFALESVGGAPAHAAAIPVRSAYAEPEAPDQMLLALRPLRGLAPSSYGYVDGAVSIGYLGSDAATALYDDLEVIVVPRSAAASACAVDWTAADGDIDAVDGSVQLSCAPASAGRWLAGDGNGDTLYVGDYRSYYVALAVSTNSTLPIAATSLPALFGTLHQADTDQRAVLNAEEDTFGTG